VMFAGSLINFFTDGSPPFQYHDARLFLRQYSTSLFIALQPFAGDFAGRGKGEEK